jgi:serine-type D-Ala-D-Ala carboxypeptidase
MLHQCFFLLSLSFLTRNYAYSEYISKLDDILANGVISAVYPGVAAMAGTISGSFYSGVFGSYKFEDEGIDEDDDIENQKIDVDSIFDLASVSKVVAGTSAVAVLYERGYLDIYTRVADILGPDFVQGGKENVTVQHCLLHNAGFNPDPDPWYWDSDFGCPNTDQPYPEEDFSCLDKIYTSFLAEELVTPPGEAFKYSDLSFITLSMVVGTIVQKNELVDTSKLAPLCKENKSYMASVLCSYEAFVRLNVFHMQVIYVLTEILYVMM